MESAFTLGTLLASTSVVAVYIAAHEGVRHLTKHVPGKHLRH